jgi:hypothetical protein
VYEADAEHGVFALFKGGKQANVAPPPDGLGIGRYFRPDELEVIPEPTWRSTLVLTAVSVLRNCNADKPERGLDIVVGTSETATFARGQSPVADTDIRCQCG